MKANKTILSIILLAAFVLAGCGLPAYVVSLPLSVAGAVEEALPDAADLDTGSINEIDYQAPEVAVQEGVTEQAVQAFQGTLEQLYELVNPMVVNVEVWSTGSGGRGSNNIPTQQSLGSGFVWDTQGHIVTNNHVVEGASQIMITFADGLTVEAELVGADPSSDLAVVKVDVPARQLRPITLTDSSQVKVGQLAIAIGNPFGLSGTMTSGIISGLSRSLPVELNSSLGQTGARYSIPDIIQTDASINPGNSGGVLVNDQGELIGVTAAIQSTSGTNSGIGFVIPANIVGKVVPVLIREGRYAHTWMGITGTSLNPSLAEAAGLPAEQKGALVLAVTAGSPAEAAGLRGGEQRETVNGQQVQLGGDVIIAIDGHDVSRFEDMISYLYSQTEVGQTVTLTVLRQGAEETIRLTLGELPG